MLEGALCVVVLGHVCAVSHVRVYVVAKSSLPFFCASLVCAVCIDAFAASTHARTTDKCIYRRSCQPCNWAGSGRQSQRK